MGGLYSVHQEYRNEDIQFQHSLAEWRALGPLLASGFVGCNAGRTAEQANADAKLVQNALNNFSKTSTEIASRKRAVEEVISKYSWKTLVLMLETLKWEEHEVLRRLPATIGVISEVEDHLRVRLPEDYKDFLLASNGVEFMPSVSAPGFRHVDELTWQAADELGLDAFRIDLGCKVDGEVYERLPKVDRVLLVSEEESEEMLWYIHPCKVAEAMRILVEAGKSPEEIGEPGWR
jgi:hypothetical protein